MTVDKLSESNLFERYPTLKPKSHWCGFSTGPGWDGLLVDLFDAMVQFPDHPQLHQVKEKFGGLRVYTSHVHPEIDALIRKAEARADQTCEWCGTTENVNTEGSGWIITLCPSCREKREAGQRSWVTE